MRAAVCCYVFVCWPLHLVRPTLWWPEEEEEEEYATQCSMLHWCFVPQAECACVQTVDEGKGDELLAIASSLREARAELSPNRHTHFRVPQLSVGEDGPKVKSLTVE